MTNNQRKGQKLINYSRFVRDRAENFPPSPCESFIFNMSDVEFEEVMKMSDEEITMKALPKFRRIL